MIRMLDEVGEQGFQSAAFLTYSLDLNFFESKVMSPLHESGCRNVAVITDGYQFKHALDYAPAPRYIGTQCPVITIRLGKNAFHPKAALLVGEEKLKVLIGSGNLTLPGYTRNWEVFTKFEGKDAAGIAVELLGVMEEAAALSPLEEAFSAWRQRLGKFSPWIFGSHTGDGHVRLICSSSEAILPRVQRLLEGRRVDELTVASPFFDRDASALQWLVRGFSPERLNLLVDEGVHLDPQKVEEALASLGSRRTVLRFVGAGRRLHGKLLLFKGPWGEGLLAGSPNLSSAALLNPAANGGNFELATFQVGPDGEFSSLLADKLGSPVDLDQVSPRSPMLPGQRAELLELEAVWVSGGTLHCQPARREDRERESIELELERGLEVKTLRLGHHEAETAFSKDVTPEERALVASGLAGARLLGTGGARGAPVWVQNLDTVEQRSNPVQRARYSDGYRVMLEDLAGFDRDAWEALFPALKAFSDSWIGYTSQLKTSRPAQPSHEQEQRQQPLDADSFYISRDEITLELPRYFSKVENTGLSIGDLEHLISTLPSARALAPDPSTYKESRDALAREEDEEDPTAGEEVTATGDEVETSSQITDEKRRDLGQLLYRKLRSSVRGFGKALATPPQSVAEASWLGLAYTNLHNLIAVAARKELIDAVQFRELVSELVSSGITTLWKDARLGREIEGSLMCGAASLVAVACTTSAWIRDRARVSNPFDDGLYKKLARPLKELRPVYAALQESRRSGEFPPGWGELADNYSALQHGEPQYRKFKKRDPNWLDYASWLVLEELDERYGRWWL
jgi:hypothetical protein